MFLGKVVLKLCSKFTGEHPCRSAISVKIFCKFFEIALRHGRSPVNLLHIFRPPLNGWFLKVAFGHLNLAMQWESRGGLYFIRKKRKKKKTKVDLRTCEQSVQPWLHESLERRLYRMLGKTFETFVDLLCGSLKNDIHIFERYSSEKACCSCSLEISQLKFS